MAGLEVDSVTKACPEFDGLFVAEVKSVKKHPSADNYKFVRLIAQIKNFIQLFVGRQM